MQRPPATTFDQLCLGGAMRKRIFDARQLVEREGLTVLEIAHTRAMHIRVRVRNKSGVCANFFVASTPSDWRGSRNIRSELRRFAKGLFNPISDRE